MLGGKQKMLANRGFFIIQLGQLQQDYLKFI
jgi:hypothetical protein